jgi:hypothetical protein
MPLIKNWWAGEIDWSTPAGQLLETFLASLPKDRAFHVTIYGSAPLQLTVDRQLLSGDVFHAEIDVRRDIIEPASVRRKQGYGESPPDYKNVLGQ